MSSYHLKGVASEYECRPSTIVCWSTDPGMYVHHVALQSSGGDRINRIYFHPLSVRLPRSGFECGAEGSSCLQAVPVEVFSSSDQSPASLCGSSNRPAKQRLSQTCFLLTFVFLCWPEGMLSSWTTFASLFISAVADCSCFGWHTLLDCFRHVHVNMNGYGNMEKH